ncbi:FtsK/SpoIIIE domain-containing protein [Actinokineospora sp. NBRC 105648]|uniref:FtsK/SpoIIIE domain-containing protein n=1 Tax=Actinokineospora sp. NBRC 105648 TaxID=3032206 RepID=UPI0024A276AB|nr:FtsK/SpoIIIE domain-containing protein [Actinokineospora sp. NBRC 105648]GLZ40612.1 cell division protein FtsK [Actinokineospora sp. NBRC 105648]
MELDLEVVVDGVARPVLVRAGARATVGQLRRAVGSGEQLAAGGVRLPDDLPLASAGLGAGGTLGGRSDAVPAAGDAPEVAVVGGLHAGSVAALVPGAPVLVGRGSRCGLRLADDEVSRVHLEVHAEPDRTARVRDSGSRNGIRVGAWRVEDTAALSSGTAFAAGESVLVVRTATHADADLSDDPAGGRLFNRPPRITGPTRLPELVEPREPARPEGFRFPWAAVALPVVLCGALYLVLPAGGMGYLVAMSLLSPMMAVANLLSDKRSGRRAYRGQLAAYHRAKADFDVAVAAAVAEDERTSRAQQPDPAWLLRVAGVGASGPASALWLRRRADADFLDLRVGLVHRRARVVLRSASGTAPTEPPTAHDVPLSVDLAAAGVLGLAGPRAAMLAVVRALLIQATVLHAPTDLGVVVITGRDSATEWEWATWLPHTRPASAAFDCHRMVGTDAVQAQARVAELRKLVDERAAERRGALADGPLAGRAVVLVLDGARRLRGVPGLAELLACGPADGVYAVCLDAEETALPDECRATVVATNARGTRARVDRPGLAPVADVLLDGLATGPTRAAAIAMAPIRPLGERGGDTTLPDRVRFTEVAQLRLCGDPVVGARTVLAGWRRSPDGRSTTALLGVGAHGPVTVDLRRDGPHALVAGTSGAGKSELLQTLVASLAAANTPDALTFVLVDYKGGSAFAACAELPHCVGMVTDLDGHLVERALASLSAELRSREERLAAAGAKDIEDYWARTGARLPRLVIVVDEFASLVEEVPGFVPGVVGIGMRGRSLGVHVLLATQRPAGVVTADLRANLNLRVSLRVTAQGESLDVVDAPDAARISARLPGRGFLRTGHGELSAFQAARIGWPRADGADEPAIVVSPRLVETLGNPREQRGTADAGARTDLSVLVAAIRCAASEEGMDLPRSPWLPPLPEQVVLDDLPPASGAGAVIGLVDRPSAQSQDAFAVDLAATGPLAIAGALRAGRSTTLRTLAATLISGHSPAEVHLYGLDCGNGALDVLTALPHCGAVVAGSDQQRADRLLGLLLREVAARERLLTEAGHGSLAEQRAAAGPDSALPLIVLLLDRLEAFTATYADRDGGRLVDRLEELLRVGPAMGVTAVLSTDRTGFGHRIGTAVGSRLVMRLADPDEVAAFGLDPRRFPRTMPAGRAVWSATGEEVQIALLDADPSGTAQAAALRGLGAGLTRTWDGVPAARLPRRVDALPTELTSARLRALRHTPRPDGPAVCTPAAGGDHLGPIDLDLAAEGGTFLVAGPPRSGRSTALATIVDSLAGRLDGTLGVLVVAPRPSPLRDLAGAPGILGVLTGDPAEIAADILDAGPCALVVDDGERLEDLRLTDALHQFALGAQDRGAVLVAAATTEDALGSRYRGWLSAVRRSRCGLLINPGSAADGELFDLRLPRSLSGGWPAGRGLLVRGGNPVPVQVPVPDRAACAVRR